MNKYQHNPEAREAANYMPNMLKCAAEANDASHKARQHRDGFKSWQRHLDAWQNIFMNEPVMLFSGICLILFFAEILMSWEIVRDLLTGLFGNAPFWAIVLISLVMNGFALVTAHYWGKTNRAVRAWHIYNENAIRFDGTKLSSLITQEVDNDIRREKILRWVLLTGLILLTVSISFYRSILVANANPDGNDISWVQRLFPVFIAIGEVFTGIYLGYVIAFLRRRIGIRQDQKAYTKMKNECVRKDHVLAEMASVQKEKVEANGDLRAALFRMKFRNQVTDEYVDPVFIHSLEIEVEDENGGCVPNVSVSGFLNAHQRTNTTMTDNNGRAILFWEGVGQKALVMIQIGNQRYEGHFQAESLHRLCYGKLSAHPEPPLLSNAIQA